MALTCGPWYCSIFNSIFRHRVTAELAPPFVKLSLSFFGVSSFLKTLQLNVRVQVAEKNVDREAEIIVEFTDSPRRTAARPISLPSLDTVNFPKAH